MLHGSQLCARQVAEWIMNVTEKLRARDRALEIELNQLEQGRVCDKSCQYFCDDTSALRGSS